jgi:methyl-accepting chemotaxis protein
LDEKSNDLLTAAAAKKTYNRGTATKAQESVKATTQAAIDMKVALHNADSTAEDLENNLTQLQGIDAFTTEDGAYIKNLIAEFIKLRDTGKDTSVVMSELNGAMQRIKQGSKDSAADELGITLDEVDAYSDAIEKVADSNTELDKATQNFNSSADALTKDIQKGGTEVIDWGQKIVSTANAIMSVSSAISML